MTCPICKSDNSSSENKIKNIWNEIDDVLFCANCDLYFLARIPNQSRIDNYYKKEYHHYSKIVYLAKNIFRRFRSASQFDYIKSNIKNLTGKKVLEIGACDGLLLNYFKGSSVSGLEYSPIYKKVALKKYNINLSSESFFELNEKFDLIIMSHVIEHLPDLNLAIEKLKDLLNDGGFVFIEVPNSPRPGERSAGYINGYLTTPHIYNFTRKSLEKVFSNFGFNIISSNRFFYNFPNSYAQKKRERLAKSFLLGTGIGLKNFFSVCLYVVKNIISPEKAYKKLNSELPYFGLGDNLRIIVRK